METIKVYRWELKMKDHLGDGFTYRGPLTAYHYSDREDLRVIDRKLRNKMINITSIEDVTKKFNHSMITAATNLYFLMECISRFVNDEMIEAGFVLNECIVVKENCYGDNKQVCFLPNAVVDRNPVLSKDVDNYYEILEQHEEEMLSGKYF